MASWARVASQSAISDRDARSWAKAQAQRAHRSIVSCLCNAAEAPRESGFRIIGKAAADVHETQTAVAVSCDTSACCAGTGRTEVEARRQSLSLQPGEFGIAASALLRLVAQREP